MLGSRGRESRPKPLPKAMVVAGRIFTQTARFFSLSVLCLFLWSAQSAFAAPDLVVTAVTAPSAGQSGGSIYVTTIVKNQGTSDAVAFRLGFFLSTDSMIATGDIDLYWGCDVPALSVGLTWTCYGDTPIPLSVATGVYYIGALADIYGAVSESNEANNGGVAANTTVISKPAPDLVVSAIAAPSAGQAGGSVYVTATVKNQGPSDAVGSRLGYFLSPDSTITAGDIDTGWGCDIPALVAGASITCSGDIYIPSSVAAGVYYIGGFADFNGGVAESSEANNGLAVTSTTLISNSATLAVTKSGTGTVTSTPAAITCGNTCSASFNSGTSVTLTATPATGSTFSGWSGACTGSGACTVTVNAAKSVTATFKTIPFAISTTGVTAGVITAPVATITNKITFNTADIGKTGAVFITAVVPSSFLRSIATGQSALRGGRAAAVPANTLILVQLTSTGWQQVINGQLIPYATGVLSDQLAAQNILTNTNTAGLQGSQFCVGYGTSASEMNAAGRMQLIASIPDPTATGSASLSCLVTASQLVSKGWNLLGNSQSQGFRVSALYSDASWVTSVWKWDAAQKRWQFFAPNLDAAALQSYVNEKSYSVLSEIKPGDGYWVQSAAPASVMLQSGTAFNLTSANLLTGWNLVSTDATQTPAAFNMSLGLGLTSLWAWDATSQTWYFYAPSLEAMGGTSLVDFANSNGYLDFTATGKTLGSGVGFWVNKP